MTIKNKFFTFSVIAIIVIFVAVCIIYISLSGSITIEAGSFRDVKNKNPILISQDSSANIAKKSHIIKDYFVYANDEFLDSFETYDEAYLFAQTYKNAAIKQKGVTNLLWDNYPRYNVFTSEVDFVEFEKYEEACAFAKKMELMNIYCRKTNSLLALTPDSAFINNVPHILQLPELPRGCEVTSLSMLINYMGIDVNKLTLAHEIKKNTEPYLRKNDKIYSGNPNDGFVGSMTSFKSFGLGVYHKPIYELLLSYFPETAIDITGSDFGEIYSFIALNSPVWIIINSQYQVLPQSDFETWHTPSGDIDVTYREHSVLITGYDEKNIYFHDPLGYKSSAPKEAFIKAWEQMGSQAITVKSHAF